MDYVSQSAYSYWICGIIPINRTEVIFYRKSESINKV